MCGRFTLTNPTRIDRDAFGVNLLPAIGPRWNVAPSQPVLLVRVTPAGRVAELAQWGLIPSWAKDPSIGNKLANARGETVGEKPSFRSAWQRRRGLMVADGFFEWQSIPGARTKQPWWITRRDHAPFAFGTLWDIWRAPDGESRLTCAIITTSPNAVLAPIHDRMPVIIAPADYDEWLGNPDVPSAPSHLVAPCDPGDLTAIRVSTWVNTPAHDDPACVMPVTD
jgi:putative SOS response-associated peptidase YedK